MDTGHVPVALPSAVTRPRPLIQAVMAQSLREQGTGSLVARAWQWVLAGDVLSPVSQVSGSGAPPSAEEIAAEVRHGRDTDPPQWGSWPPWRYAFDRDPGRQQARRVLRWLTGASDAIPLLDPARGRHIGARFHFARTDEELRRVRDWARHGIRQHGDLPGRMSRSESEHPWQWPSGWMNAAWLRGAIAYLDWILGDSPMAPLTFRRVPLDPAAALAAPEAGEREEWLRRMYGVGAGAAVIEDEITGFLSAVTMQGHEGQPPADPDRLPSPQWGEGAGQAHDWATGEDDQPPADHHGCGGYYPCPGMLRCTCEAAGHCLRGQCPACRDKVCNAGSAVIEVNS